MNTSNPQSELEQREAAARVLMKWLVDHPNSPHDERIAVRTQLNDLLQEINDLVCQTRPPQIYLIR